MTNNGKIVKIETSDELASVIDNIITTDAKVVFLVIDDDAFVAQNVLNFRLIKREAETVDKEIVVVTRNSRIRALASKAELKVKADLDKEYEEVEGSGKKYTREVIDIMPPSRAAKSHTPDTADLRHMRSGDSGRIEQDEIAEKEQEQKKEPQQSSPAQKKPEISEEGKKPADEDISVSTYTPRSEQKDDTKKDKERDSGKKRFSKPKTPSFLSKAGSFLVSIVSKKPMYTFGAITAIIAAVALGYLLTVVLPKATIVLNPYSVEDELTFSIVADSNISSADHAKGVIPAQILEERQEQSFTYKATGTAQLEERAVGTVTVYNEYSSNPQTLVANTRLVSSDGKLFRTTETVVVPGAKIEDGKIVASSTTVPVRADEPGQDYNIGPSTFSIPGFRGDPRYLAFYGKSEEAMSGGYSGVATVITENDINGAREKIEVEFLPQIEDVLRSKVPEALTLVEESLEARVETLEIDGTVGDPKEEFSVRFVGTAQAFLIKEEDIDNSIAHHFINSTEYSKDFELDEDREVEYVVKELDFEKGYTEFNVNVNQQFNRIVDTNNILEQVKGKDEVEVRRILSGNEALERAQVRFWPFWVSTVPDSGDSIEVQLEI